MIISVALYDKLVAFVTACLEADRSVSALDAMALDIPFDTLSSLFSQFSMRQALRPFKNQNVTPQSIIKRVDQGESFYQLSTTYPMGRYKLAKIYLETKIGPSTKPSTFLENPGLVTNPHIRHDLLRMIAEDHNNSVEANLIKESTGKDYEDILIDLLRARHMCFETEEESRAKGKPKTPDILFLIPMATTRSKYDPDSAQNASSIFGNNTNNGNTNYPPSTPKRSPSKRSNSLNNNSVFSASGGVNTMMQTDDYIVINWIDSKAMCADRRTFSDHLKQLESYRNRYGRGMVLYWHGIVEDVFSQLQDDMIIVRDSFPSEWLFPTGDIADGLAPPAFDLIDLEPPEVSTTVSTTEISVDPTVKSLEALFSAAMLTADNDDS